MRGRDPVTGGRVVFGDEEGKEKVGKKVGKKVGEMGKGREVGGGRVGKGRA